MSDNTQYEVKNGAMPHAANLKIKRRVIQNRKVRVAHVFTIARLQLKRRGWDKNNNELMEANPCSLVTIIEFACINKLSPESDFDVQHQIVVNILNTVVKSMSRGKYNDYVEWEQNQRSEKVILRAVEYALYGCTKNFD